MPHSAPLRGGLTVAAVFFLAAIALSGVLPLWLDEIIQLRETRGTSAAQLMTSLPRQPGAAPLGYLTQQASLAVTGYSVRWARFPSAVFGAGTVLIVALTAAEFEIAAPWSAAALFALFPIILRYACESRIYSQALFLSSVATLLFIWLIKKPGWLPAVAYCLSLAAAVYSQPYAIFVAPAHIVWAVIQGRRKAAVFSAFAAAAAAGFFIPWYLWTRAIWSSGLQGSGIRFAWSPKTPLMLFREMAGAGYWGSGLLLMLCILALCQRRSRAPFLLLLVGAPIVLALVSDAAFGYFVAARQILWVLPAVAILAAMAIGARNRVAIPAGALLALFCLWQDYRYFTAPHENWEVAANALSNEVSHGACLVVVPQEQEYSYEFFRPDLAASHCPAPRTVVAFTPYATDAQRRAAVSSLASEGYARQSGYDAGKSQISLYAR